MNRLDGKLKEEPEKASGERASEAQKKYCCDYRSYYIIMRHGYCTWDKLKKYVGTDEYIEEVAREKLGLVKENEILFRAQQ